MANLTTEQIQGLNKACVALSEAELGDVIYALQTKVIPLGTPVGTVITLPSFISTTPVGYLKCNGAVLNATDYPDLFTTLGSVYGGNGVTNFCVPTIANQTIGTVTLQYFIKY